MRRRYSMPGLLTYLAPLWYLDKLTHVHEPESTWFLGEADYRSQYHRGVVSLLVFIIDKLVLGSSILRNSWVLWFLPVFCYPPHS